MLAQISKLSERQRQLIILLLAGFASVLGAIGLLDRDVMMGSISSIGLGSQLIAALPVAWLVVAFIALLSHRAPSRLIAVLITIYFGLALSQTVFSATTISPLSPVWVMILGAVYLLLGRGALHLGGAIYAIVQLGSVWLLGTDSHIALETAIVVGVISLAYTLAYTYSLISQSNAQLHESRQREVSERDRTLTLINNITDAVFGVDEGGRVKTYNSAALNLLDTNANIDGRYISDLMSIEDNQQNELDVFEELSKNHSIRKRDDLVMRLEGEDSLRLEATFAPVQSTDNQLKQADDYVLILRDITRLKSLEEERDEFISVVSHELRTPVAVAEGSLSNSILLIQQGQKDKASDAIKEAHRQVVYLARMVNDLSMLSRAERGLTDEAELINVIELAHQLHHDYVAQAEEKGLKLDLDLIGKPSGVYTSRLYLKEILQNLITNSIKYTEHGSVTVRIKNAEDQVLFEVEDTGIGIGKADLKNIFKRFYRAEDYRTRETNGTGLGLYVCSKLAKKIGTQIKVRSRVNHGSTFSLSLPAESSK